CGGGTCAPCPDGKGCVTGAQDCTSLVCTGGVCQAPTCTDGVKNANETDVDCGGPTCTACTAGKSCLAGSDCDSTICTGGVCQAATCTDGVQNEGETDIDCGGPNCVKCAWTRAGGGFAGTPCFDGIKYDATGVPNAKAYVCTTDNGVNVGPLPAP